jgi:hypothetical protein
MAIGFTIVLDFDFTHTMFRHDFAHSIRSSRAMSQVSILDRKLPVASMRATATPANISEGNSQNERLPSRCPNDRNRLGESCNRIPP